MKLESISFVVCAAFCSAALLSTACSDDTDSASSAGSATSTTTSSSSSSGAGAASSSSSGPGGTGGSAGAGGTAGMGGAGGAAGMGGAGGGMCVPTAEVCNGLDEDCNTVADNGCPIDISMVNGGFGGHAQYGNLNGGTAFADPCAPGSGIYRMTGNVDGNVDRIEAHCATLSLAVDTVSMPYVYSITRGPDLPLGVHGQIATTPYDFSCPADEFVVGVDGQASGGGVHDLTIHCAALVITGAPGSFAISYGAITTFTIDGTNTGASYADLLTAPKVVERYRGRSGSWIDAIGIGDADVLLVLQP